LGDYQSIKAFADELIAEDARLDIVVQNAAILANTYVPSTYGFENRLVSTDFDFFFNQELTYFELACK